MSAPQPTMDNPLAGGIRPIVIAVLRMIISTCVILVCYHVLPVRSEHGSPTCRT